MSCIYIESSAVPLAKASHVAKPSISVGGQYDGMNTDRHEKFGQYLFKLDRHVDTQ